MCSCERRRSISKSDEAGALRGTRFSSFELSILSATKADLQEIIVRWSETERSEEGRVSSVTSSAGKDHVRLSLVAHVCEDEECNFPHSSPPTFASRRRELMKRAAREVTMKIERERLMARVTRLLLLCSWLFVKRMFGLL